jgi:hypothetical protein
MAKGIYKNCVNAQDKDNGHCYFIGCNGECVEAIKEDKEKLAYLYCNIYSIYKESNAYADMVLLYNKLFNIPVNYDNVAELAEGFDKAYKAINKTAKRQTLYAKWVRLQRYIKLFPKSKTFYVAAFLNDIIIRKKNAIKLLKYISAYIDVDTDLVTQKYAKLYNEFLRVE